MSKKDSNQDRLVYSTDLGSVCPDCQKSTSACICKDLNRTRILGDGRVRVKLDTSGRAGKTVTCVSGLALTLEQLSVLLKDLKTHCGAGGTIKEGVIEIQGDRLAYVIDELKKRGFNPKRG